MSYQVWWRFVSKSQLVSHRMVCLEANGHTEPYSVSLTAYTVRVHFYICLIA